MDTEQHSYTLEQIPANRRLLEELYAHGKISNEARKYGLQLLYPHKQWGLWASRLLLSIGTALVLSGIVYFFAFNWAKVPPFIKLSAIQLGMIGCLIGAYCYSLQRINGQILLLSASLLVGVFMAVFGQIYQTGADAYQLFMMWVLLTLGWTLISNFAVQWILWLLISNIFLFLWWDTVFPSYKSEFTIYTYMAVLNGIALAVREYFAIVKAYKWLEAPWIRAVLIIPTLLLLLIPMLIWIMDPKGATDLMILNVVLGLIGHALAYYCYRHKLPDVWALSATILSTCMIIEAAVYKVLTLYDENAMTYLIMGLITLGLFTYVITYLRKIAKKLEGYYV